MYTTDKHVAPSISMSLSALYNKKLSTKAIIVQRVVEKALPVLKTLLNVPKDVTVRIAPIKARNTNGRYYNTCKVAEIDCRLSWDQALVVLCHEMVHAEQYHQKRLVKEYVSSKGWVHSWHGSIEYSKGTTYRSYRSQPWEAEAFDRQNELATRVNEILEKAC